MRERIMYRRIALALASMAIVSPLAMHPVMAAAEDEVYDFGSSDIYAEKSAEPAAETKAEPAPVQTPVEPVTENEEEAPAAYAGGQVSTSVQLGVLGDRPTLDVPFNITGYTNKMMEDNQVATVDDVIVHDPSVSDQTLSGVSSAWNIRGFKAQQQDVQLNGLYGIAPRFYGGVEGVDRVDVLKGPSAILAGIAPNGSLGGTINYITKRAGSEPLNRVKISYGSDSVFTQQIDFGRRTDDGKAGLRINVLNRNGETSFDEHVRTDSITIGADYKGDRYRLGFDYGYVYNKVSDQQYQLTIGDDAPKTMTSMFKVPRGTKFGADGGYRSVHEQYGMLHGEYDFSKDWTGYFSYGLCNTKMEYFYNSFSLSDRLGNATMDYKYNNQVNKADSGEVGVRGKFFTGGLKHELTVAANRIHYTRYMKNNTVAPSSRRISGTSTSRCRRIPTAGRRRRTTRTRSRASR